MLDGTLDLSDSSRNVILLSSAISVSTLRILALEHPVLGLNALGLSTTESRPPRNFAIHLYTLASQKTWPKVECNDVLIWVKFQPSFTQNLITIRCSRYSETSVSRFMVKRTCCTLSASTCNVTECQPVTPQHRLVVTCSAISAKSIADYEHDEEHFASALVRASYTAFTVLRTLEDVWEG